jgi:hypothetical protein
MVVAGGPDDGHHAVTGEREAGAECATGGRACGRQFGAVLTVTRLGAGEEPGGAARLVVVGAADERGMAIGRECDARAEGAGADLVVGC